MGTKPAPRPWILWGDGASGSPAMVCAMTARRLRLDSDRVQRSALRLLEESTDAGEGPTGAHPRDEDVHFAVGVVPDFRAQWWSRGWQGWRGCRTAASARSGSARLPPAPRPWRWRPSCPVRPGVRISLAPNATSTLRLSMVMVSGMVSTHSMPRDAAANASAMPVLPLVASMMVLPGPNRPRFSASATMAAPMRHLTEYAGFRPSILASTVAEAPAVIRLILISGVRPMDWELSSKTFDMTRTLEHPPPRRKGARQRQHRAAAGAAPTARSVEKERWRQSTVHASR